MARLTQIDALTDLAEVFVALALELRAGVLPDRALVVAAASSPDPDLRVAVSTARCAEDPSPALLRAAAPLVRALGSSWRLSMLTGAPLAVGVERLAAAARGEAEALRTLEAALAGPRSSARILAALPLLGLLLGQGMGASPVHVLLTTEPGWACLVLGTAMAGAGLLWTDRLVRSARRGCVGAA